MISRTSSEHFKGSRETLPEIARQLNVEAVVEGSVTRSENRVRIKVPFVGGGYGSKIYIKLEALVTALSLLAHRPVKIALTMEEQFYQITKHPSTLRIKTALDNDKRITARRCEVFWNGGAYADIGPRVTQKSGFVAAGPYDIENVWIDSYALYTHTTPSGALRGFGLPQLAWAYESHTDMVASVLKLDPIAFRRKNLLREGRPHASGTILRDAPIEAVLDQVCERMRWHRAALTTLLLVVLPLSQMERFQAVVCIPSTHGMIAMGMNSRSIGRSMDWGMPGQGEAGALPIVILKDPMPAWQCIHSL